MFVDSTEFARRRQPSLLDSLELVLPSLPAALVRPEAKPWLVAMASVLPPVHHAGFECRLGATETTVDLQQGVFATHGEPARLARFLAQAGPTNETWASVRRLAERWSTPGDPLHRGVDEIWLELDAPADISPDALVLDAARPSVFAVVERAGREALPVAREVVGTLVTGDDVRVVDDTLTKCSLACPEPARISHVGVMLGRSVPALRVHVRELPPQAIEAYLARIGWKTEREEVASLAAALLEYGDWVVVCLDIVGDEVSRLGLECFFSRKHGLDPRWRPLLERLTALGVSSADKARALLDWPDTLTPLDSPGPWPEDLIAQSLTQPEDALSLLDRRLSHVKLTFAPDQAVTAKAYFGYVHVWMRGAETETARGPRGGESVA